jgi:hypothetical protein
MQTVVSHTLRQPLAIQTALRTARGTSTAERLGEGHSSNCKQQQQQQQQSPDAVVVLQSREKQQLQQQSQKLRRVT